MKKTQHGFPPRLIVPGWYGMTQVKWLSRIDALSAAFDGVFPSRVFCVPSVTQEGMEIFIVVR
ncbi:MAG TPA: molybdopterin-dependent oxidoreductase [Candidatus Sulfotelmatobacter sp.]|nr:molybdopterin-dependent oxidoreductase [Candidatus Sulfotelmatobacter sp.]